MTIRDLAHYQFNAIRNNYTSNTVTPIQQSNMTQVSKTTDSTQVNQVNQVNRANSDSLQFLNQYKSNMNGLASAADKIRSLSKDDVWSDLEISSSNEGVVSNATTYGKVPQRAEYDIDVKQLAQRQISTITPPGTGFQDGEFHIKSTDSEGKINAAAVQIDTKGGTASQEDMMNDMVDQINRTKDLGVKASIVEKDGESVIQLESSEPGAKKNFTVEDIESETTQEAQNLVYTLNGKTYEEGGNHNIQIDPSGSNKALRLNFNSVGKANVMADVDKEKLTKYTEHFVETYNKTIDFLVDNAHRGSGATNALDRFMQSPISKDAMKSIGMDFGRDGKITFDAGKFDKAMKEDTRMVYDILADNYSVADTIYQKADKAANSSTASLLDNSKLENNNGGTYIINNYNNYFISPSPFSYPGFPFSGSLFFNARV